MKKWIFFLVLSFIPLILTSCQKKQSQGKLQIIVSIPAYEKIVQDAVAGNFEVICVVPEGFNAHYFEVRPKDLDKIQNPVVWYGINESFEPKLLESLKARFPNLQYYSLLEAIPQQQLIHECSCHHHHHHDEADHHHDLTDNHIWMSPKLMIDQMRFIQKSLPIKNDKIDEGFTAQIAKLNDLDAQFKKDLKPYEGQAILASHGSFGYFCKEYGLVQITIETEGKQPMPKDLENLATRLKNTPVICVFAQVQFDQKGAILIAKKLKKPLYSIDPYSKNYFEMQEDLVAKILKQP
jgi:zinc transport system substrate-binding protein